jgi:flagellin-like protein
MKFRKLRKNVKAVSPVISVLLMIAVAVAASLVTYAWVMGYLGFTTNKVGKAIQIQSVTADGHVYAQNVGDSQVTISSFYVDGTLDLGATATLGLTTVTLDGAQANVLTLQPSDTADIVAHIVFPTDQVTVKVVSTDGTSAEFTKTFP